MKVNYKKIYNRRDKLKTDGTAAIIIEAYLNRKRKYFNTGINVEPKFWDVKKNIINNKHKLYQEYNRLINNLMRSLEDYEIETINSKGDFSLTDFDYFQNLNDNDFLAFFEEQKTKKEIKKSSKRVDTRTLKYLREFKRKLRFSDMNYKTITEFNSFLLKKNLHINTVHMHHKCLKSYINLAIKNKLIDFKDNPYIQFKAKKIETNRIALDSDELKKLSEIEFHGNDENIQKIRDMFLFSCYTGLRYSDLQQLQIKNINKNNNEIILSLRQQKTDSFINIPINIIFEGKPYDIVSPYLVSKDSEAFVFPRYTNQAANRLIKVISISAALGKNLTFHVARHTFGTLLATHTGDQFLIQNLMGHADIKTSMIYIHLSNKNIIDKLNNVKW